MPRTTPATHARTLVLQARLNPAGLKAGIAQLKAEFLALSTVANNPQAGGRDVVSSAGNGKSVTLAVDLTTSERLEAYTIAINRLEGRTSTTAQARII